MKEQTTIFTIMSALALEHKALNLAQGFPSFPCEEQLLEKAYFYMKQGFNQYSPMSGALPLRQVIQERIFSSYNVLFDIHQEICVTAGATEAVFVAIQSLVSTGDEVIILEPAFDIYAYAVQKAGAIPNYVPLNFPDFSIDWDKVESAISSRTKLLILNSPHNPTGATISEEDLEKLAFLVEKYNFLVLSDEVYERIIFDGKTHCSVLKNEILREKSLVTFSLGKTFHVTGWRVGYCVGPKSLMQQFKNLHQYVTFCTATPLQLACADFYQDENYLKNLAPFFQQKRDYFLEVMKDTPFIPIPSSGTYFQLMSYQHLGEMNDMEYAKKLVEQYKVASIPISFFYHDQTDHKVLRFCFAKEDKELEEAAKRLSNV